MFAAVMRFWDTSIGKKIVMAVTGLMVVGWISGHMAGNLQIFAGPEKINHYGAFLKSLGGILWAVRGTMLAAICLHMLAATQLTLQSWAARPQGYARQRFRESTYAARTMRWGGPLIAGFVVAHLLHFTTGQLHPTAPFFDASSVYNNVIAGFQVWWVAVFYIVVLLAIGLHLYHGVWSMLQTLGLNNQRLDKALWGLSVVVAVVVTAGFVAVPVAVLVGWLQPIYG